MATKELQDKIVHNMKNWQKIENASVSSTGSVIEKTDNAIIRLIMEIVQNDSQMHHRVQQLIIDSMEREALSLSPEELADVWGLIEKHIQIEKQTIEYAKVAIESLKGTKMVVQEYLINYLLRDEEKHNAILEDMEKIKKGMYPYG